MSDTVQSATTGSTCSRRMPWRSTKAFCAPIAAISVNEAMKPTSRGEFMPSTVGNRWRISTANDSSYALESLMCRLDGQQLAAFAAVIELGSFDAAAERSARHAVGGQPADQGARAAGRPGAGGAGKACTATAAGVPLLRLAAQTALLESEALAEMGGGRRYGRRESRSRSTPIRCRRGYRRVRRAATTCCSISGSRTRITPRGCCAKAW